MFVQKYLLKISINAYYMVVLHTENETVSVGDLQRFNDFIEFKHRLEGFLLGFTQTCKTKLCVRTVASIWFSLSLLVRSVNLI